MQSQIVLGFTPLRPVSNENVLVSTVRLHSRLINIQPVSLCFMFFHLHIHVCVHVTYIVLCRRFACEFLMQHTHKHYSTYVLISLFINHFVNTHTHTHTHKKGKIGDMRAQTSTCVRGVRCLEAAHLAVELQMGCSHQSSQQDV